MKHQNALLLIGILIASQYLILRADFPEQPSPSLPGFMSIDQMAVWKTALVADNEAKSKTPEPENLFYTGKPLVSEMSGYVFKYRTYNPFISRWMTSDPKDVFDGLNNLTYGASPISGFDTDGLAFRSIVVSQDDRKANYPTPEVVSLQLP